MSKLRYIWRMWRLKHMMIKASILDERIMDLAIKVEADELKQLNK